MGIDACWGEKETGISPRKRGLANAGIVLPSPPLGPKVQLGMLANAEGWFILRTPGHCKIAYRNGRCPKVRAEGHCDSVGN